MSDALLRWRGRGRSSNVIDRRRLPLRPGPPVANDAGPRRPALTRSLSANDHVRPPWALLAAAAAAVILVRSL